MKITGFVGATNQDVAHRSSSDACDQGAEFVVNEDGYILITTTIIITIIIIIIIIAIIIITERGDRGVWQADGSTSERWQVLEFETGAQILFYLSFVTFRILIHSHFHR